MNETVGKFRFLDGRTSHAVGRGAAQHAKELTAEAVIGLKGDNLEDGMRGCSGLEDLGHGEE
eukprot:3001795-Amphidinium_carterae.1